MNFGLRGYWCFACGGGVARLRMAAAKALVSAAAWAAVGPLSGPAAACAWAAKVAVSFRVNLSSEVWAARFAAARSTCWAATPNWRTGRTSFGRAGIEANVGVGASGFTALATSLAIGERGSTWASTNGLLMQPLNARQSAAAPAS